MRVVPEPVVLDCQREAARGALVIAGGHEAVELHHGARGPRGVARGKRTLHGDGEDARGRRPEAILARAHLDSERGRALVAPAPVVSLAVGRVAHALPRAPRGVVVVGGHLVGKLLEHAQVAVGHRRVPVKAEREGDVVAPAVPMQHDLRRVPAHDLADRLRLGLREGACTPVLFRAAARRRAHVIVRVLEPEVAVEIHAVVLGVGRLARLRTVLTLHAATARPGALVPRIAVRVGEWHEE